MRCVIQRVKYAKLSVNDELVSSIKQGLYVTCGVCKDDTIQNVHNMARKLATIRIFDRDGKLNDSVKDLNLEILLVSNFTLCSTKSSGARPDFSLSADKEKANSLYLALAEELEKVYGVKTSLGRFAEDMQIETICDGPITIYWEA